jgi:hypothetical protein
LILKSYLLKSFLYYADHISSKCLNDSLRFSFEVWYLLVEHFAY